MKRTARANEARAVRRWLDGQKLAAARSRRALTEAGPDVEQAVAEAISASNALAAMGVWPGPRDPGSEAGVEVVRQRWVQIQKRAIRDRTR